MVDENFIPFIRIKRCPSRLSTALAAPVTPALSAVMEGEPAGAPATGGEAACTQGGGEASPCADVGSPGPAVSEIPEVAEAPASPAPSLLGRVKRVIDIADKTEHDAAADVIADNSCFVAHQVDAKDEEQDYCMPCHGINSAEHLSMHLPRLHGCPTCDDAKHLHRYKLRRKEPVFCVTGQDAINALDWIEIRKGTKAYNTAHRSLMLTDDLTSFLGANPTNSKDKDVVVEAVHRYDDAVPAVRRWWSDRAAEFLAAARYIRSLRPLAHFTSVPWRHAPRAERSNRTATEGTRCAVIQSGFNEAWWALALLYWVAMWNGFMIGKDGLTPYERRHETPAPYRQYAFGALVLLHPHRPVPRQGEPLHDKLQSRLVPCVLVEVTVGPGGIWARSYGVIPLSRFTSENRPSRASIRRSCDIVFPDIITFPLKQRLALHGALADKSLPEPLVSDDAESWELAEDRSAIEDEVDYFDGKWKENAAKFETSTPLEHILALEPDTQDAEDAPEEAAESK